MLGRIAEEKINEIRQSIDIVELISDYVQLSKQGRNYFGLCPFHGEKTPSFSVSPEKQIYHCFGCGAGGDAFSFLMELEGYSFQEAALKLAEKANIELELPSIQPDIESPAKREHRQMIEAHELLRKLYHHILVNTNDGQKALEYLLKRGFTQESIEKYQIGFALNSWDFAVKFFIKRDFPAPILEKAGLIIKRENNDGYFDRFRNRIMFPIFDGKGNTIAFSGRMLGPGEPKYLNSPETPLFNKSKILYNYHFARPKMRKLQQAILFEGFADCIAADRAGVENGVATMGTSLTEDHVALIRRNVQQVTLCYDGDDAGIEAAYRAGEMFNEAGFQVRVALMPEGMDPDEYIAKFGGDKFQQEVIGQSQTFMSFKLLYFRRGKDLRNEGDRLQYVEDILHEISSLKKAVERDHYLRQLADEFNLSLEALKEQQRQIYFANKKNNKSENSREQVKLAPIPQTSSLKPAYYTAERRLIYHMMRDPAIAYKVQNMLGGLSFNIDEHQAIFTYLLGYYEKGLEPDPGRFINYLDDDRLKRMAVNIEMMSVNDEVTDEELNDYIKHVLNQQKMLKIKEKEKEQKEAERQSDFKKASAIAQEIIMLRKSLFQ